MTNILVPYEVKILVAWKDQCWTIATERPLASREADLELLGRDEVQHWISNLDEQEASEIFYTAVLSVERQRPPRPKMLQPHERTRKNCKALEQEARDYVAGMEGEAVTTGLADVGAAAITWLYGKDYWAWEQDWGRC